MYTGRCTPERRLRDVDAECPVEGDGHIHVARHEVDLVEVEFHARDRNRAALGPS
jgi:hypothetical protein